MVEAIWSDMDLRHPPVVERLPRRATATLASANRLSLFLPERLPAWCLLHEIAHAMSTTIEGCSARCRSRTASKPSSQRGCSERAEG